MWILMADLTNEISEVSGDKISAIAIKTFFNIMDEWEVPAANQANLLGLKEAESLDNFKISTPVTLTDEILKRISYILGIYKGLGNLLPTRTQRNKWIKKPNVNFGSLSALDYMSQGEVFNLREVREYIDAQINN